MTELHWILILAPGAAFPGILGLMTALSFATPVRLEGVSYAKGSIVVALAALPFFYVIGLIVVFSLAFPLKTPADTSNRFNRLRLWWFATSAPHRYSRYYSREFFNSSLCRFLILWEGIVRPQQYVDVFPWMKGDEVDNMGRFWAKSQ